MRHGEVNYFLSDDWKLKLVVVQTTDEGSEE
jgi:hypothetical protein